MRTFFDNTEQMQEQYGNANRTETKSDMNNWQKKVLYRRKKIH